MHLKLSLKEDVALNVPRKIPRDAFWSRHTTVPQSHFMIFLLPMLWILPQYEQVLLVYASFESTTRHENSSAFALRNDLNR